MNLNSSAHEENSEENNTTTASQTTFQYPNGLRVTDTITGFQGTITGRIDHLFGCLQYIVTPTVDKDGNKRKVSYISENRISVDNGNDDIENIQPVFAHELGMLARDKITGFKGVLTARVDPIDSCIQYVVFPKTDEKGAMQSGEWLDEGRVEIINDSEPEFTREDVQSPRPGPGKLPCNNPFQ